MITEERQTEINAATTEIPVRLTHEEVKELREEHKARFQQDVGAGKYILPIKDGSPAAQAVSMNHKGYNNAYIAKELGISESVVRRVIEHNP